MLKVPTGFESQKGTSEFRVFHHEKIFMLNWISTILSDILKACLLAIDKRQELGYGQAHIYSFLMYFYIIVNGNCFAQTNRNNRFKYTYIILCIFSMCVKYLLLYLFILRKIFFLICIKSLVNLS